MTGKDKKLFSQIIWFETRTKVDFHCFDILEAQRTVSSHPRYKSGIFFSEKCQRNVQYESGMELAFIKLLEASKRVRFYYEQPVQIPYSRGKRRQTYTPDFAVFLQTDEVVLVEIKCLSDMLDNRVQLKMESLLQYCRKKGFGLLFTDLSRGLVKLREVNYNRKLERAVLKAIEDKRVLSRHECREILKEYGGSKNELLKIICKQDLKFKSKSGKIEQGNNNRVFRHVFINRKQYSDLNTELYPTLFSRHYRYSCR